MKKLLLIFLFIAVSLFIGNFVLAGCICNGNPTSDTETACGDRLASDFCIWRETESGGSAGPVSLPNPLGEGKTDIPTLLGKIVSSVLGVVGSLALVMFIYGGITWMLSAGNQEQVTKGKNILIWATVGIVIIFTAYALVRFVLTTVTS
ncbi:MAG: pilin [Patescibacteria group bacterium]|jgi:type IV secretory pathway VirB2 component (pilin)